jgi:hypothetical protein
LNPTPAPALIFVSISIPHVSREIVEPILRAETFCAPIGVSHHPANCGGFDIVVGRLVTGWQPT